MRSGGLVMVVGRALDRVASPEVERYRAAIVLGALREDVIRVPGLARPVEHWSLSHFWRPGRGGFMRAWPGARAAAVRRFTRAVAHHRAVDPARAYVELGRAAHVVVDMACPVHVHRALHDTDRYEWYVEAHADELAALPAVPTPQLDSVAAIVDGLARLTAVMPVDRHQHAVGRWLRRRGLVRPTRAPVRDAAIAIIPAAIAHVAALIERFAATTARPAIAGNEWSADAR
ncbi:MAG: hypothetical protein K8W52_22815 [Deltaproteobacteria bacterium]|nr:hypothetical protein [Deltaproteobacteria bacterium]